MKIFACDCLPEHKPAIDHLVACLSARDVETIRVCGIYIEGFLRKIILTINHPFDNHLTAFQSALNINPKGDDVLRLGGILLQEFNSWVEVLHLPSFCEVGAREVPIFWHPQGIPEEDRSPQGLAKIEFDDRAYELVHLWGVCLLHPRGWHLSASRFFLADLKADVLDLMTSAQDKEEPVSLDVLEMRLSDDPFIALFLARHAHQSGFANAFSREIEKIIGRFVESQQAFAPAWRQVLDASESIHERITDWVGGLKKSGVHFSDDFFPEVNYLWLMEQAGLDFDVADDQARALGAEIAGLASQDIDGLNALTALPFLDEFSGELS